MEQKRKSIGTTTYLVTQMDAVRALTVQAKLVKILGAGVFSAIESFADGDLSKEKLNSLLSTILPKIVENFDDELAVNFVLSLFETGIFIDVNGVPKVVDFATHFIGKPAEMWKVVAFILETNFSMGE